MKDSLYQIMRFVAAIVLFIGGIVILILRIPFWSLILGIPAVQIGLILIIFTFDAMGRWTVEERLEELKKLEDKDINNAVLKIRH